MASRWEHIAWLAVLFSTDHRHRGKNSIFNEMSQDFPTPILYIHPFLLPSPSAYIERSYRSFSGRPVRLCAFVFYLPQEMPSLSGMPHAVGFVADFAKSNTFYYFDPRGPTYMDKDPRLLEWVQGVMNKIKPVFQQLQAEGILLDGKCTKFCIEFPHINIGVQRHQMRTFAEHGIRSLGMCAFMTAHLLYRWVMAEGARSIPQITDLINQHFLDHMTDFARTIWYECLDTTTDRFKARLIGDMNADSIRVFPPNEVESLARRLPQYRSPSSRKHKPSEDNANNLKSNARGGVNASEKNSGTSVRKKKKKSEIVDLTGFANNEQEDIINLS